MKKEGAVTLVVLVALVLLISATVVQVQDGDYFSPKSTASLQKSNSFVTDSKIGGGLRGGEPNACYFCDVGSLLPTTFNGCYGDVDGNGVVNAGDRGSVSGAIGSTDFDDVCKYDLDGNGVINAGDRGYVAVNIGLCAPLPDWQNGNGIGPNGQRDTRFGGCCVVDEVCHVGGGENSQNCPADCDSGTNFHAECSNSQCVRVVGTGASDCGDDFACLEFTCDDSDGNDHQSSGMVSGVNYGESYDEEDFCFVSGENEGFLGERYCEKSSLGMIASVSSIDCSALYGDGRTCLEGTCGGVICSEGVCPAIDGCSTIDEAIGPGQGENLDEYVCSIVNPLGQNGVVRFTESEQLRQGEWAIIPNTVGHLMSVQTLRNLEGISSDRIVFNLQSGGQRVATITSEGIATLDLGSAGGNAVYQIRYYGSGSSAYLTLDFPQTIGDERYVFSGCGWPCLI